MKTFFTCWGRAGYCFFLCCYYAKQHKGFLIFKNLNNEGVSQSNYLSFEFNFFLAVVKNTSSLNKSSPGIVCITEWYMLHVVFVCFMSIFLCNLHCTVNVIHNKHCKSKLWILEDFLKSQAIAKYN